MSKREFGYEDVTDVYDEMISAFKRLQNNSDLAIMCVDGKFVLVNTKDNKFNVIKTYKLVHIYIGKI